MYRRTAFWLSTSGSWSPFGSSDRLGSSGSSRPNIGDTGAAPASLFQQAAQLRSTRYSTTPRSSTSATPATPGRATDGKSYAAISAGPLAKATSSNQGIHLYANKENAWSGYTDDRFYGAKRFREYWRRMLADRGVRYYIFSIIVLLFAATAKLWSLQQSQRAESGLLGPRKKQYRSRLTVVLDVDETLVSYGDKAYRLKAGMVPRPYLAELLDYLSSIDAEVVLWTAASERYLRQVLSVIDPNGIRISQYITRDREWFTQDNYYEKNLLWLKRPLADTIMIENRALSVRNCNANSILVDDFIRGEYMDSGQDYPTNDHALQVVRQVIEDLETSGTPVPEYLQNRQLRAAGLREIPCHLAVRQLPDELARGVFYFIGDKYKNMSQAAS